MSIDEIKKRYNEYLFLGLEKIKENSLYTPEGEAIKITPNNHQYDRARGLLKKLEDLGGIRIIDAGLDEFFVEILQPKFDELYRKYENINEFQDSNDGKPTSESSRASIIKIKTLELISQKIANLDTGNSLVNFLVGCGVDKKMIEYPQTKWRMINSVLVALATSSNSKDKKTLSKIIEESCHPLMHSGNKISSQLMTDKFNGLLEYDNFMIKDGVLWQGWDDGSGLTIWTDKDGNKIEPETYLVLPKTMTELYVFWNELIKLTRFYFSSKNKQDDEINNIYFEIIGKIENLLDGNGSGGLKEQYKKPFRNLVGCEFEIEKQGLNSDSLFVNLYDFLGKITELSLPDKDNVEKIKKENDKLFKKIDNYKKRNFKIKQVDLRDNPKIENIFKLEISKMPELKIQGLENLSSNNKESKYKFPHKLPAGTEWKNFTFQFEDDENIYIQVKQYKHYASYKEMGFIGKGKNPKPSEAWTFLKVLATQNGELSIQDAKAKQKYKKQKEILSKALKTYFTLESDPFFPYDESRSYRIRMTLIPPQTSSLNNLKPNSDKSEGFGLDDYYKEQAREV